MQTGFFEIQSSETRRIWLAVSLLFLVYIALLFIPVFALMAVFQAGDPWLVGKSIGCAVAIALCLLVIQAWFADRYGVQMILQSLRAEDPDPEDSRHQRFVTLIEELGVAAGGIRARAVIAPTLSVNAFTLADRRQLVIGLTEGILSRLSRNQALAVAAHEMAHIVNGDCRLATWVCAMSAPFLALGDETPKVSRDVDERDGGRSPFGLAIYALVKTLTVSISRGREIRADAKAVELTRDPQSLAEALLRIANENHYLGGAADSFAPIFIVPSRLESLDARETFWADLFSSHPPLDKRLQTLAGMTGQSIEQIAENAARRRTAEPAWPRGELEAENEKWELRQGESWTGPFSLAALAGQTGFQLQSWIRRAGSADELGGPAWRDPALARQFRLRGEGRTASPGACPACGSLLRRAMYEGTPIGRCEKCGGALVAYRRVQRILARRETQLSADFLKEAGEWLNRHFVQPPAGPLVAERSASDRHCPQCGDPMTRQPYSYQYFVPIERCYRCEVIWFDASELELLQALVERRQSGVTRPPAWEGLL